MSYTSSLGSSPASLQSSSLASTPTSIQIGFTPAGNSAAVNIYPSVPTKSSQQPVHAYSSSSFNKSNAGRTSAYLSDEDLFGIDNAPCLREAPAPPRPAHAWIIPQPLLPPLPPSRRRSSGQKDKKRRTSSSSSNKK